MATDRKSNEPADKGTSLLEWISAVVGGAIAAALLAFLVAEGLRTKNSTPPVLTAIPTKVASARNIHVVEVTVTNLTGQTAAGVSIEGTLNQDGQPVETSTATLTFVPGRSQRSAGLIFQRDPRRHRLEVRATGYEEP